jgi:hypothetical protein
VADVTKMVGNRVGNSRTVVAALDVQVKKDVGKLDEILFRDGSPTKLSTKEFIDKIARALEHTTEALGTAEQELVDEQGDDEPARANRDRAHVELRTELDELQGAITGAYGFEMLTRYQLSTTFPPAAELLLGRARAVHGSLKKGAPDARPKKGRTVDFPAIAEELAEKIAALDTALNVVKREDKEVQVAFATRDAAVAMFEFIYTGAANIAVGLLQLIGNEAHAERVRPTARRRSGAEPPLPPEDENQEGGGTLDPTAPGGPFEPEKP